MKALISPNEGVVWISGWEPRGDEFAPIFSQIEGAQRVAQVEETSFDVAPPLHWIECPEECVADLWHYKNGALSRNPEDVPQPQSQQDK